MSTSYYLVNRKKYEEYQAFQDFWENRLVPHVKESIENYCSSVDGEYVNNDTAEDVLEELENRCSFCPLSMESASERVRAYSPRTGFFWDNMSVNGILIYSLETLHSFLEDHPEYFLQDEYSKEISFEKFCEETEQKFPAGRKKTFNRRK